MVSFWERPKPIAPPMVPTDTVIPVHYWDDTALCRAAVLYDLMRFDDVLDVGKLKTSLEKLLHRDGWRKLGARVRLDKNGRLNYHVPKAFDETRPPFSFHHDSLESSITDHPVASRLPVGSSSGTPQIMGSGAEFLELMRRPGDPETLQDYLTSDLPMLGLRVVSFVDATLVTISWPHILLDGMARKPFLNAWSLVLQGHEDEVPPLHGVDSDPLATLGTQSSETYKHADKQLSIWQLATWGFRYLFDKWWRPQTEESRIVFVPSSFVRSLREQALSDVRLCRDGHEDVPFLSEGDVLCAWWTRQLVAAQLPANSSRTVALNNAFGLRGLLSEELLPSSHEYIANAFCMVPVFMPAKDVLGKPLGLVAAAVRRAYVDLGTRPQVEALAALHRAAAARSKGGVALFGDPWMHMVVCTNWTKAELFDTDFSGALVAEGRRRVGRQNGSGKPSFVLAHAFAQGFSMINGFMITGRDGDGNFWLYGILRSEVWPAIERALKDIT